MLLCALVIHVSGKLGLNAFSVTGKEIKLPFHNPLRNYSGWIPSTFMCSLLDIPIRGADIIIAVLWCTLLTWENLDRGTSDVYLPALKTALGWIGDSNIVGKALSLPPAPLTDASSLKTQYLVRKNCV